MSDPVVSQDGLQAERTDLSWSRTALSCAVNGGLLLMQHRLTGPLWLQGIAVGLALALFVLTLTMSRRRRRVLVQRPLPSPLAAPGVVGSLTLGTILLGIATLALVLVG
ncbi:DUF202 domain-containing protein [Salinisphaera sp. Q1T1-3]|uniref:DUF202 domain-containing protein n=1 Tax=Salinisphaera sp. Q1T1-3 TaxID=2321229 RepID=UPI000E73B320|nr:DUF202 domain-containing protein [Salinisphaera sp. Q1T1-3]RJS91278.1 DUF202 domain-containing protein [Salinisphaera sp. Q1T1-3]